MRFSDLREIELITSLLANVAEFKLDSVKIVNEISGVKEEILGERGKSLF